MINTQQKNIALISGITGQDGQYLANYLISQNYEVIGLSRSKATNTPFLDSKVSIIQTDYSLESLNHILNEYRPKQIYNLAGQTYVGKSWITQEETLNASAILPTLFLRSIIETKLLDVRFFQASSSEIYANSKNELHESSPIAPINPYGCAKAYAHFMVKSYRENYNLYCVNGILFNHESPLRNDDFLSKKVVTTAFDILESKANKILLGNLDVKRDWGFAGDYSKAMYLSLTPETADDYNICSGSAYSVRELVDYVFKKLNLNYLDYLEINKSLVRNNEREIVLGSNQKAEKTLGWKPETTFNQMLDLLIENEKIRRGNKC